MKDKKTKTEQPEEMLYFIFFKTFQDAIDKIPDPATQLQLYKAIANYALFEIEPELNGVGDLVWGLIRPTIERSLKRQQNGRRTGIKGAEYGHLGAAYGVKGGRPPKNPQKPKPDPDGFPTNPKQIVNFGRRHGISREVCEDFFNYNSDGNDNDGNPVKNWRGALLEFAKTADPVPGTEKEQEGQEAPEPIAPEATPTPPEAVEEVEAVEVVAVDPPQPPTKKPRPRFRPPTVEEVAEYCRERANGIDANEFVDFYTANGWTQGKGKPIKDWRACVRTWERHTDMRNRTKSRQQTREELMRGAAARLAGAIENERTGRTVATADDTEPF